MRFSAIKSVSITGMVFVILAVSAIALFAQLPQTRISGVFPPGGKAGSTIEVTVTGADLDEPSRLHFSNKDITAKPTEANKFSVTIGPNVPPGVYEARFVGRFGISNPRAFVVGALPESISPSTNTTAPGAIDLAIDSTTHGRSSPNTVAWFKFSAKKSQRVLIECLAESIDSRMDAALVLTDLAGHELERNRASGLIDFSAPADGAYFLKVFDVLYRGGEDYFYRLTISTGPRIDFVMPPAGLPGTRTNYTLYGRNLPGGKPAKGLIIDGKPLEQVIVTIDIPTNDRTRQRLSTGLLVRPSEASVDGFEYRLSTPKGVSNPVLIGFATAPVVLEQEPNSTPAQAQRISPPCEVAGQFFPDGDPDWFRFDAKKGDVFWVEVFSQRLGLPTDPFLVIQRVSKSEQGGEKEADVQELYDNDTNIGDREFNTATRDPVARFEAKEDGVYRLQVRDLFQRTEHSSRFFYRLSVRKESPDFRLVAQVLAPRFKADAKNIELATPLLRHGETIPIRVMAFRRDGFNGDIELSLEKAPPGLLFDGDILKSGKSSDFILLTAADNAPAFAGPIKLVGKARIGDRELVREARYGTMIFPVGNTDNERPDSRLAREFTLALSEKEEAPLAIAAIEKKTWESTANGKIEIPLRITRHGEFAAKLKLKPLGPGTQDALKEFETEAAATNVTLKLDLGALKLQPGTYSFAVQAITTGKYRNNPEAAALADDAAKAADKLAAELTAAAKKADEEFGRAKKSADEADAAAKTALEKLGPAKTAAEKSPDDTELKSGFASAQKASDDAAAAAKSASSLRATAEKARSGTEARAKDAQAKKEETAKRAKDLTEKAKPREVSFQVTSTPISVKVAPAQVAAKADSTAGKK